MEDYFQKALAFVLGNEGGAVDDPRDAGGATNYGITAGTLQHFTGSADVSKLTPELAAEIYRKLYWDPIQLDRIFGEAKTTALMDVAVNQGPGTAVRLAQQAMGLDVDGIMGPATVSAINGSSADKFVMKFSWLVQQHYAQITMSAPEKRLPFLLGWIKRSQRIQALAVA